MSKMMLRVGLIGLGPWGKRLLTKLFEHENFEVVGAHDPLGSDLPLPIPSCGMLDEFWEFPMDAVVVAVSPSVQGQFGIEVLRRGFPLFIEKPMALSLDVAEEIVALSSALQLIVHVNHVVRYDALHRRALDEVQQGGLGELLGSVHIRMGSRSRPNVSAHSVLLPHDLALIHQVFGYGGRWDAVGGPQDTLIGRRSNLSAGSCMVHSGLGAGARRQTLYVGSRRTLGVMEGQGLRIAPTTGQAGVIERRPRATELGRLMDEFFMGTVTHDGQGSGDALADSLADFARAVRQGRSTCCDAREGARVTEALVAIDAAASNCSPSSSTSAFD